MPLLTLLSSSSGKHKHPHYVAFWLSFLILCINPGCQDGPATAASGYPEEIADIMLNSCATTGCHNAISAPAAGGLNLESWSDLFEGARGGSPIVPFSPNQSYLLYSVNTDTTLGPTLSPTMPFNQPALSSTEYAALWNWIYDGAPDAQGKVRFPPQTQRRKWYVGHQICDQVAIFDAESRQLMRYLDVGQDPEIVEYVFDIQISPNGEDWFVVFFGPQDYISRYSTRTDEKITDIEVGWLAWSTLTFSKDGKLGFLCSEHLNHLQAIDLVQNVMIGSLKEFSFEVRGARVHPKRQEIYLAEFKDRGLTVVNYNEQGAFTGDRHIDLVQDKAPAIPGDLYPFEITFLPDGSKYFVSCNNSQEVRVMDGQTDSLLEVINLPAIPSKMAFSASTNRLFVSCMEDLVSWPANPERRGSIAVINAQSHKVTHTLYSGFQPYSMAADDELGVLVVTNRNTDPTGPVPHHSSTCEGRNGYVTLIDLQTLSLVDDYKPEILADPSTVAIK